VHLVKVSDRLTVLLMFDDLTYTGILFMQLTGNIWPIYLILSAQNITMLNVTA